MSRILIVDGNFSYHCYNCRLCDYVSSKCFGLKFIGLHCPAMLWPLIQRENIKRYAEIKKMK